MEGGPGEGGERTCVERVCSYIPFPSFSLSSASIRML